MIERGRLGRTGAFMARLIADGWLGSRPARAIAIDRATAVLVEPDGRAAIVGPNTAYFMQSTAPPQQCRPGMPLTFHPIAVYTVTAASTFNLATWTGTGGTANTMSIVNGSVTGPVVRSPVPSPGPLPF